METVIDIPAEHEANVFGQIHLSTMQLAQQVIFSKSTVNP